MNRHFSKEDTQRTQRHRKGCSASLATREMQIRTTMRYHFMLVRMAIINKLTNKCWKGCRETGTQGYCWWECRLWKTAWNSLKTLKMFIAAQFTIAKFWKQHKCPSVNEWIKKLWYIYTMEYYAAGKKNSYPS